MRLSKVAVKERESFVQEQVKSNPELNGSQLQELLFQRFGKRMANLRLYQVKNEALAALQAYNVSLAAETHLAIVNANNPS